MDAQEVMHMTNYSKITALYSRLSVGDEDRDGGESNSIQNQKIFLENYARGQHLTNIRHYIDDDESGRFFDRSAYSRMMDDVENGKIGVCIMKDLTRWGRDYLQVGNAMEIFRRNNVRFIAVNNGIDSENPDTLEFAPFINIMSEWYAKDISKKVKTGIKTKGMSGKPIVNGIYNDTAEIISMAAVYYQQDWPSSQELAAFTDDVPFTQYCRALTAYGMEITARESAPYSCISYGGCVNGYRSEGETVTITEYRCETHTCAQGNEECGHYRNGIWEWSDDHEEGGSCPEWIEDGTHDVTVFFPVIFPDGATQSELCTLPDDYAQVVDGKIAAEDCTGSIVLDESANLYKGELNDWFYAPNERTATFTVETTDGDETMTKDYTVTFANATAIPWCPGELHDGQYGHYDLNCTIYLTGYDRYADPETEAPNGADGGTGNLEALAESSNDGTLTRTVIKQDQYGNAYAGNAVTARFTKTVTLPPGAAGFKGWYENGADTYGNVEWASLLYRMDWEALYGVADGIKCRSVGSALTVDELQALLAGLNIDPDTARGQVVAFAISCQGHFVYGQPSSLRGGPGNASVGMNLDCSSFVQYCYWAQGLPFSAGNTAAYGRTGDLRAISPAEVQPGDLRVVYATGGEQGHVQMALGGGAWIECCYGYGVCVNMSNAWMESRGCHYFTYAGF